MFRHLDGGLLQSRRKGLTKVVLYTTGDCTRAARQLASGRWTSKLGNEDDIEHDTPDDVAGGVYGNVAVIMRRKTGSG